MRSPWWKCAGGVAACVAAALVAARTARADEGAIAPASYGAEVAGGAAGPPGEQAAMIRQLSRHRGGQPAALAQVIQMSRGFDDATAAEILEELAAAHERAGAVDLAAEARAFIAERFPNEARGADAVRWLVRLYASSEAAHARRSESAGAAAVRRQLGPAMARGLERAAEASGEPGASKLPAPPDQRAVYALHLATQATAGNANLERDSALQFQRAVAARRAGQGAASEALLSPLKHRGADDPWSLAARAEEWLAESPRGAPPLRADRCAVAAARPHLDGVLDEACWQAPPEVQAEGVASLPGGDGVEATQARWAYDAEYLYVALVCRKASGVDYARDDRPRPRDGDLAGRDRVRLLVDVDRDYATWYELTVDCSGWTNDACWGDLAWNPTWYVARGETSDGAAWTIEAAIPLAELSAAAPAAGEAWACAAVRQAPEGAAAGTDIAALGPGGFCVLVFR